MSCGYIDLALVWFDFPVPAGLVQWKKGTGLGVGQGGREEETNANKFFNYILITGSFYLFVCFYLSSSVLVKGIFGELSSILSSLRFAS